MTPGEVSGIVAVGLGGVIIVFVEASRRFTRMRFGYGSRRHASVFDREVAEECGRIISFAESFDRRVRGTVRDTRIDGSVPAPTLAAYDAAVRQLRRLRPPTDLLDAVAELERARRNLWLAWQRTGRNDAPPVDLAAAADAHAEAIRMFAAEASILVEVSWRDS